MGTLLPLLRAQAIYQHLTLLPTKLGALKQASSMCTCHSDPSKLRLTLSSAEHPTQTIAQHAVSTN